MLRHVVAFGALVAGRPRELASRLRARAVLSFSWGRPVAAEWIITLRNYVLWTSAIVAAVLVTPASLATWFAFGTHEPDNALDSSSFMWTDAPPEGSSRIYFNAINTQLYVGNPNVGALGTQNEVPFTETPIAMLGVWKDCNGDGYVGMLESVAVEYSSALLADTDACPPLNGPQATWPAGAHNYNGWVTELVPIAGVTRDESDDRFDLRVYRDAQAMVWGDYGRPTDGAEAGGTCALWPQPLGTYHSTGGMINWVDCSTGTMEAVNSVFWGRRFAGQQLPGLGADPFGLSFPNDDDARGHAFWDRPTFGSDDSSQSAVSVFDCSGEPTFRAGDALNQTPLGPETPAVVHNIEVLGLAPGVDPAGTIPATVNETNEAALEDCDTSNDRGNDFYALTCQFTLPACIGEGEFQGVSATRKTEADWNLQFTDYSRGRVGITALSPPAGPFGPSGIDPFLGLQPLRYGLSSGLIYFFNTTSMWNVGEATATAPSTLRVDLVEGSVALASADYRSFYAFVGQTTLDRGFALPSSSVGQYGSNHCEGRTSGVDDGWECDPAKWYINSDGSRATETYPFARIGQSYQLRDVDCTDGSNDLGVAVGTAAYGDSPCP